MKQLVKIGVPYLYWLQREPDRDWTSELDQQLGHWLGECKSLGEFPAILTGKRAGDELASHAALLWDDPNFVPIFRKISPNQR
jgi:hypothetical protein